MFFEVWAEDDDGHQELMDTTSSLTEAERIAKTCLADGFFLSFVLQETEDGDLTEVRRFENT